MFVVFGATGFIGRHIQAALAARGTAYVGFGRLTSICVYNAGRRAGAAATTAERARLLDRCPAPQAVIFAAGPALATGDVDALRAAHLGSLGEAFELLSQPWSRGLPLVYTSSALVYGRRRVARALKESDAATPSSAYGELKLRCEERIAEFAMRAGVRNTAARLFNVVGPGQAAGIVVDIARQIGEIRAGARADFHLRSNTPILDIIDVREVADGLIRLAEARAAPAVVNVCSGRPVTTDDMIASARKIAGREAPVTYDDDRGPCEALVGDPALMALATGWRAQNTIGQILPDVVSAFADAGKQHV